MEQHRVYTTAEVVKMSSVTSRTLRYYQQIGLLEPCEVSYGGIRHYGRDELLKLQRILLLKEQGVALEDIKAIEAGVKDKKEVLRAHQQYLLAESRRLQKLADTVEQTLKMMLGKKTMKEQQLFDGFDHAQYRDEAIEKWGKKAMEDSEKKLSSMSKQGQEQFMQEAQDINTELAKLMQEGVDPADQKVQKLVARHYEWIKLSWTPDAQRYKGLGQMYVCDERFTKFYDKTAQGLAQYLNEGIEVFAQTLK